MQPLTAYLESLPNTLTSADIVRIFAEVSKLAERAKSEALDGLRAQEEDETNLFLTALPCRDNIGYVRTYLYGLTPRSLKELVEREFYNPELERAITCITNSIIQPGGVPYYTRIQRWYRRLTQIGTESISGLAFSATLDDVEGLYVFKTVRPGAINSLLHEYLVGTIATNPLRETIPNFAYIYGAFNCAPPLVDDKTVVAWCTNNKGPAYLVYENIAPSISYRDHLSRPVTVPLYLSYLLQLIFSLRLAAATSDFTHYDLHYDNVLMREVPGRTRFYIPYPTERGTEYLLTDRVATIIDYGSAHFTYRGTSYGSYSQLGVGILPRKGNVMADIYKIFMFGAAQILGIGRGNSRLPSSNTLLPLLRVVFRFFNPTEPLENALRDQDRYFYTWPSSTGATLDTLLSYLRAQTNVEEILVSTPGPYPVLSCRTMECLSQAQVFHYSGLIEGKIPTNFFDTYDLLLQLDPPQQIELLSRFPYQSAITRAVPTFLELVREEANDLQDLNTQTVGDLIPNLSPAARSSIGVDRRTLISSIWLRNLPPGVLFTPGTLEIYQHKVYTLGNIYFRLVKLSIQQLAILTIGESFKDKIYAPQIAGQVEKIAPYLTSYITNFTADKAAIDYLRGNTSPTLVTQYSWYWEALDTLLQILK